MHVRWTSGLGGLCAEGTGRRQVEGACSERLVASCHRPQRIVEMGICPGSGSLQDLSLGRLGGASSGEGATLVLCPCAAYVELLRGELGHSSPELRKM